MATWYSIKNQLVGGHVKARNELERFFTSLVTSYGCIDIWYRNISSDSNIIECRIFYLQEDSTFNASDLGRALNSWERTGERPRFWLQLEGTTAEIRASIVSFLPQLSRLHNEKRHGEWNFGADQPFEGQGTIITVDGSGNTVITGRFGDIRLGRDGQSVDWEDITWSFSGCAPTATAPPSDLICFTDPGSTIEQCRPTGAVLGTCVCGNCCEGYTASYITQADCTSLGCSKSNSQWIEGLDYTNFTSDRWNTYFSCAACTGTCVTGNCTDGFTASYPVTEAACTGHWYRGVNLSGQSGAYWNSVFGCGSNIELGCCVLGNDCTDYDVSVTTSAGCDTRASSLSLPKVSFTPGKLAKNGCTLQDIREDNNCTNIPGSINITLTYALTLGAAVAPGWEFLTIPGPHVSQPFWWGACNYDPGATSECAGNPIFMPAVSPGSAYTAPELYNRQGGSGVPSCSGEGVDSCRELVWYTGIPSSESPDGWYDRYHANYTLTPWDNSWSGDNYTGSYVLTFVRDTSYNGDDEESQRYYYSKTTVEQPQWITKPRRIAVTKNCCFDPSGFATRYWFQPDIDLETTILNAGTGDEDSPFDLIRAVHPTTGEITYVADVQGLHLSSVELSPRQSGFSSGLGSYHAGWEDSGATYPSASGAIGFHLAAPKGPGSKVNTFGATIQESPTIFGSQFYLAFGVVFTESCQVTVTVAES